MHRVAEDIRGEFPEIDTLVAKVKQIFLKAPNQFFFNEVPVTPLP